MEKLKKILLVDDEDICIKIFRLFLKTTYELTCCETPKKAILLANENIYDIFILDIYLRDNIDGKKLMKILKEDKKNKYKIFIATTSYSTGWDRYKYLEFGFDEFLLKPFDKNNLLGTLKNITS
ncbi:polar-differentiation response regulator DivK [bacterium BMS3Abin04]|nr:polar-differentiation response regulator DivK [bacterium BMS3Abin04]